MNTRKVFTWTELSAWLLLVLLYFQTNEERKSLTKYKSIFYWYTITHGQKEKQIFDKTKKKRRRRNKEKNGNLMANADQGKGAEKNMLTLGYYSTIQSL